MFRFTMPDPALSIADQVAGLREQGGAFLESEALREAFRVPGVEEGWRERHADHLRGAFDRRTARDGRVLEIQELEQSKSLEACRDELYPLIEELGFLGINEPLCKDNARIIVLGGSLGACQRRTSYAKQWVSAATCSVDGLACYRPINPIERKQAQRQSDSDTEFGVLAESLIETFQLTPESAVDDFCSDRNLNGISCVRSFGEVTTSSVPVVTYRVFAAPSTQPDIRRADTGDSVAFWLRHTHVAPSDSLLAITDNRHCNRQFLQIACQLLQSGHPAHLDVVGCTASESIPTRESYEPHQYVQDLIGLLDWIEHLGRIELGTP